MDIELKKNKYSYFGIHLSVLFSLFLVIAIIAAYWQITEHDFINFDDDIYVFNNFNVKAGLTYGSIKWAFSFTDIAYWHPLTWISHMLDCQLFGLNPGMHHITNLILHIASSILLFLVFKQMTGALWRSAFLAALFALHPINVESVAWIAERKNVLSAFFWMLTMLAYVHYSKRQGLWRYLLTLFMFLLGLMCKPILVTLPFVLFLLDYWPLGRMQLRQEKLDSNGLKYLFKNVDFQQYSVFQLIIEKVPFLILSAASVSISVLSAQQIGAILSTDLVPIKLRIANAVVSYLAYIGKLIWPQNLAVFYPYPQQIPIELAVGAGLSLLSISFLMIWSLRGKPYFGVGWLWYIGTLLPSIGLFQGGLWPAMADRWAYVPFIGIFIIIAWSITEFIMRWRLKKIYIVTAAIVIFMILMFKTWLQVHYWANSIILFEHNLNVTSNNYVAHNNIGLGLKEKGRINEAAEHYSKALRINPNFELAYLNLGVIYTGLGYHEKAIALYKEALRIKPDFIKAHINLGNARLRKGNISDAVGHYSDVLDLNPDSAEAYNGLGAAMVRIGKFTKAINYFNKVLLLKPDHEGAKRNLKNTLAALERNKEKSGIIKK